MSVTLTARGRSYAPPAADDPAVLLSRWHAVLERLLALAIDYGRLDALARKRHAWCDANPFHPLHGERHAAMWATKQERNALGGRVMDLAAELSHLQARMPESMVDGLGALLGHPLWPYCGQVWAMAAARLQTTDVFALAAHVLMASRAEEEA